MERCHLHERKAWTCHVNNRHADDSDDGSRRQQVVIAVLICSSRFSSHFLFENRLISPSWTLFFLCHTLVSVHPSNLHISGYNPHNKHHVFKKLTVNCFWFSQRWAWCAFLSIFGLLFCLPCLMYHCTTLTCREIWSVCVATFHPLFSRWDVSKSSSPSVPYISSASWMWSYVCSSFSSHVIMFC
jgi:hypothetical protein